MTILYFLSMLIHHRREHLSSESCWYNLDVMHMCNFHYKQIDSIYIHPRMTFIDTIIDQTTKEISHSSVVRLA